MFNELCLVKVSAFKKEGSEADRNGAINVYLTPVAGKIPNRAMVVAGTVAEGNGLKIGNLQLVLINEVAPDEEYGRQFTHTVLDGEVKGLESIGLRKELGGATVVDAGTVVDNNDDTDPTLATSNLEGKKAEQPKATPRKPVAGK